MTAMPFVVKAIGPQGSIHWLTAPRLQGERTFCPRELAEEFETHMDAWEAVDKMEKSEHCSGIVFSVERTDVGA
jgi:hypothetical protein